MKKRYAFVLVMMCSLPLLQPVRAELERVGDGANDTIRTYTMNEVVVTSSTKETNQLHQLPAALSVVSPQTIHARQVDAIKDLSAFVPNLFIPDYGSKLTSAVYIRGIGTRSSGQSIGLYVDNVPYLDKSTFDFELSDIQRIEVLRGPQGTLYGRNAMGGIINIYTQSPLTYQGTKVILSGGNYGLFGAKASHYNKLSDRVGISLSGYYNRHDGFFKRKQGGRIDDEESAGGRFKLDWLITPNLRAQYSFVYDYTNQRNAFAYGAYHKDTDFTDLPDMNDPSAYWRRILGNHLFLEYKTDQFVLTSTTGYQYFKDDMKMDQDFSPKSVFTLNQRQKQHAWSEEVAIKSNTGSNYQWSFGAFGFYDRLRTDGPVEFKEDGVRDVLQKAFDDLQKENPGMPELTMLNKTLDIPGTFRTSTFGLAAFHQSTYNNLFTEGLSVTAGVRLDYEKVDFDYDSHIGINPEDSMRVKLTANFPGMPRPVSIPLVAKTTLKGTHSQDFLQLLPKVSLRYQCSPGTFTYVSVSKGYKTGGYNVQMFSDLIQTQSRHDLVEPYRGMLEKMGMNLDEMLGKTVPVEDAVSYKPEHSWNYEAGIRSELVPDRLHGEVTFFLMDVRDMQLTKFVDSGSGRMITNAGKARSYGVELTLLARLAQGLTADVNYGYTHATFRDYKRSEKEVFDGNYLPYAPRHTLSLGLNYSKLLRCPVIDQFTCSLQYTGAGKIYWTEANDLSQNFYGTVNGKIGVRKGMVRLDVWARNLFNADYKAFYFESFGNPFFQKGKPLQAGVDVAVVF